MIYRLSVRADRYIDALVSRFDWLCDNPRLCKPRPDVTGGLYSFPQQSHVIFFQAQGDPPGLIEIVRVLHGRMEPARHV